jgi:hypothetical protein
MILPDYKAPLPVGGPRWIRNARVGQRQTDPRGVEWRVERVEQGGRVLHWTTAPEVSKYPMGDPYGLYSDPIPTPEGRVARTEINAEHPDYPSDADVVAAARAARKVGR